MRRSPDGPEGPGGHSDHTRHPPRIAEWLLRRVVGTDTDGRSILGDAREEFDARGRDSRFGPSLWYWTWVVRFAVGYRTGGRKRRVDRNRWGRWWVMARWDLRSSIRALLRRPGLSATVIATLGVGIGASTLSFALVDGVLLRPLPYPDGDALVDVSRVNPDWFGPNPSAAQAGDVFATPTATFFDWERQATSFSSLGAYAWAAGTFTGDMAPERIEGAVATSGLFEALAVAPYLGRAFTPEDLAPGAEPVVVLGHGLWVRRFGADPNVVGRRIALDGVPTTVIGVMPAGFAFPYETTRFWRTLGEEDRSDATRNAGWLHALGRLAPGASLQQARTEIAEIQRRLGEIYSDESRFIAVAYSRQELMVAAARPGLLLLLGAAAVVLLVGCANVANLLLTRATERRRELALHAALGAGRSRLSGLLLCESLLLALLGGAVGVVLARLAVSPFVAAFPMALPRTTEIQVDPRVFAVAFLATVATGVLLGLLPVARATRLDLNGVLRDGGYGSTGGRRSTRTQSALVIAEVALSVLLLGIAGVFVESYLNAAEQDRGFTADDVLAIRVALPESRADSPEEIRSFYGALVTRLGAIPGVRSVGMANQMPYGGCCSSPPATVETPSGVVQASIQTSAVSPTYFETMGIPIVRGRGLRASDGADDPTVIVVSEAMARRYWPDQDPIGRRVRQEFGPRARWAEVVGIAGNVRYSFGAGGSVEYYQAFAQRTRASQAVTLKVVPGAAGVAEAAEDAIHTLEPTIPVSVRSMADLARQDQDYRSSRVGSLILAILASIATGLAILGVYSVLAHGVARRTREIGIRVSLGGTRQHVLATVLRRGLGMSVVGVVVGLALSVAASSVLRAGLVNVGTVNPRVLLGVTLTTLATSVAASLLPAWRAARVDPLEAFRQD